MVRRSAQPNATRTEQLVGVQRNCLHCGRGMWQDYENRRRIRTLNGLVQLRLKIRRCPNLECVGYRQPYRPEAKGQWALPQQEFGLDVIALVGQLRHQEHRSVGEIHQQLQQRNLCVSERTVSHLLARYDELVALRLGDRQRLRTVLQAQQQVVLAIDGLQPDVGHEVLWVIRDCLSGEILLSRTLLSATHADLAALFEEVKQWLPVPIAGAISDGQHSIRKVVSVAFPEVAHGLCQFHYLREAARQIYDADRHAKKELKKQARGARTLEQQHLADDVTDEVMQGYCQAARSALTDDGRPPLDAAGLRLQQRVSAIEQSLARVEQKGGCLNP